MLREINRLVGEALAPLQRRLGMMVAHAGVLLIDATQPYATGQVELLSGEVLDEVEVRQDYGFASAPLKGAEGVYLSIGGVRAEGVVICVADRRYRLALVAGEVALYDDQGQMVHLKRDQLLLKTPFKVVVEAPQTIIDSPDIRLGGAGADRKVARVGDDVVAGKIVTGSDQVRST